MARKREPQREYVYLMGSPTSPLVKIGRSNNPKRRLAQVQEDVSLPLEVLWTTPGGKEMELGLHQHFAEYRRHGEWFELGFVEGPELVAHVVAASDWETESFTMWQRRPTDCTRCGHHPEVHGKDTLCNSFYGWGDDAARCPLPVHRIHHGTRDQARKRAHAALGPRRVAPHWERARVLGRLRQGELTSRSGRHAGSRGNTPRNFH